MHFVWIMGADNLRQFHRWRHWRAIADLVPIVVVDRPGSTLSATSGRAGAALAHWRAPERDGGALCGHAAAGAAISARAAFVAVVNRVTADRRGC